MTLRALILSFFCMSYIFGEIRTKGDEFIELDTKSVSTHTPIIEFRSNGDGFGKIITKNQPSKNQIEMIEMIESSDSNDTKLDDESSIKEMNEINFEEINKEEIDITLDSKY